MTNLIDPPLLEGLEPEPVAEGPAEMEIDPVVQEVEARMIVHEGIRKFEKKRD